MHNMRDKEQVNPECSRPMNFKLFIYCMFRGETTQEKGKNFQVASADAIMKLPQQLIYIMTTHFLK